MSNFAMPGINSNGDNFFDFEAASTATLLASSSEDLSGSTQTALVDEEIHVMSLTESEKEAILAARASNAQKYYQAHQFALPKLQLLPNFSGSNEASVFTASPNFENVGILSQANFDNIDMLGSESTHLDALEGRPVFAQPSFEEPAEAFEAVKDLAPFPTDESR